MHAQLIGDMKCAVLLFFLTTVLWGDQVLTNSGRTYTGQIISEDASNIVIQQTGMAFSLPKNAIKEIRKDQEADDGNEIPSAENILAEVKQLTATDWIQIPATVIDNGVLKNVPYMSYRSGNLELNIYGDPAAPAGLEVGLYDSEHALDESKMRFINFMTKLTRARFSSKFKLQEDKKRMGNIDYEVTPPTAPDAYGGWWISAYDQVRLGLCRLSDNEVNAISIRKELLAKAEQDTAERTAWTALEISRARPSVSADLGQTSADYVAPASYSGGRVYVRSYFRANGTFVNSYTRRR